MSTPLIYQVICIFAERATCAESKEDFRFCKQSLPSQTSESQKNSVLGILTLSALDELHLQILLTKHVMSRISVLSIVFIYQNIPYLRSLTLENG